MTNSKPTDIPTVEVEDLYIAAWLLAKGAELAATKSYGAKNVWVFRALNIDALVQAFHNNGAVAVQDFISRLRGLRSMIRTGRA